MNILHHVTRKTLKENRTRTMVTIIGIVLSAAMVCAVTTFVSSFSAYMLDSAIDESGDWYGQDKARTAQQIEEIQNDEMCSQLVKSQNFGYAKVESRNDYKPYVFVAGMDADFARTMPVHLTDGRLPENSGELLIPAHLLEDGGVEWRIGDTVTLELGGRGAGGQAMGWYQNEPYDETERLYPTRTASFSIVGTYERPDFEPYEAPGYTVLTANESSPAAGTTWRIFVKTHSAKAYYEFEEKYHLEGSNWSVLAYSGASRYENFYSFLYGFAAVVILIIIFGSVALIYNAFSISVGERTKQFGLLVSVGATKRQIRSMVFHEAMVLAGIGIPIGILCGIGGISVTLYILRGALHSLIDGRIDMTVHISWTSVLSAVVIALLTVLISAWVPARRATKVSAVDAIRQNQDICQPKKAVRVSKATYRLFGLEGVLASKQFRRSKKRYRATVISLFMSVVLFISASSFSMYLTNAVGGVYIEEPFDLVCDLYAETPKEAVPVFEALAKTPGVTQASYYRQDTQYFTAPAEDFDKSYRTFLGIQPGEEVWLTQNDHDVRLCFVQDTVFEAYLQSQALDPAQYMNPEAPLAVVYDDLRAFNGKYYDYSILKPSVSQLTLRRPDPVEGYVFSHVEMDESGEMVCCYYNEVGDKKQFPADESSEKVPLALGKRVKELPFGISSQVSGLMLLYPFSAMDQLVQEQENQQEDLRCAFEAEDHRAVADEMEKILEQQMEVGGSLSDLRETSESDRNMLLIIRVFSYGFIILISLIAVANVFNTISTNIALRRREFAILRSVGMTSRGMRRMMNYECLLYGLRSLAIGLPVSAVTTYLIYRVYCNGVGAAFQMPWTAVAIAVGSVFLVVFSTMLYAIRKVSGENPIDDMRCETT